MAGTPAICKTASVQCDPIGSFWVRNPQVPIFRDLGCSTGASLLPSLWGLITWQGGSSVSGGATGTLSGKSVYWGRSPGQISEGKSRSQPSPGTISWHSLITDPPCRPQDQDQETTECSFPFRVVCLSPQLIHSANSSCPQPHQDQDRIGNSVPRSCLRGQWPAAQWLHSHRGLW